MTLFWGKSKKSVKWNYIQQFEEYFTILLARTSICIYRSSSHSSSSDSDSSSDASSVGSAGQGSVKRYNKKKNLGLKSKTPDKYLGWQYRLRIGVDQDQWQDDTSLRIEALKGTF